MIAGTAAEHRASAIARNLPAVAFFSDFARRTGWRGAGNTDRHLHLICAYSMGNYVMQKCATGADETARTALRDAFDRQCHDLARWHIVIPLRRYFDKVILAGRRRGCRCLRRSPEIQVPAADLPVDHRLLFREGLDSQHAQQRHEIQRTAPRRRRPRQYGHASATRYRRSTSAPSSSCQSRKTTNITASSRRCATT